MLLCLSPSKDMNFDEPERAVRGTQPRLLDDTDALAQVMKGKSAKDLKDLMGISDKLAELNVERYKKFQEQGTSNSAKQAALAFTGDVYRHFDAETLTLEELDTAQSCVRILSGLYGVLRPLDMIQPYRLEMGIKLATDRGESIYDFWGNKITNLLNEDMEGWGDRLLLNLSSNEYFSAVNTDTLKGDVLDVKFLNEKDGKAKVIGLFAKRARGAMARWIVQNNIDNRKDLSDFDWEGYSFERKLTTATELVFKRKQP
ncbi:MAG: hypothetical protein CMH25_06065 [Micavibrio sp.]|nr:hypothetical protein [Micavibrio sp.]|tara:strand:+ start:97229 stop:98002 length:774 start_codon:yes stop_codon:yes gene_type:complete